MRAFTTVLLSHSMAYASDLLAFRLLRLSCLTCLRSMSRHRASHVSCIPLLVRLADLRASPHYANPSMYNAFLVLFGAKREGTSGRMYDDVAWTKRRVRPDVRLECSLDRSLRRHGEIDIFVKRSRARRTTKGETKSRSRSLR